MHSERGSDYWIGVDKGVNPCATFRCGSVAFSGNGLYWLVDRICRLSIDNANDLKVLHPSSFEYSSTRNMPSLTKSSMPLYSTSFASSRCLNNFHYSGTNPSFPLLRDTRTTLPRIRETLCWTCCL